MLANNATVKFRKHTMKKLATYNNINTGNKGTVYINSNTTRRPIAIRINTATGANGGNLQTIGFFSAANHLTNLGYIVAISNNANAGINILKGNNKRIKLALQTLLNSGKINKNGKISNM